jgi:hypothetical protein
MSPRIQIVAGVAAVAATVALTLAFRVETSTPEKTKTPGAIARAERMEADRSFYTPRAREAYAGFIEKYKDHPDKVIQDEVGAARLRLAHAEANRGDFTQARKVFKEAAKEYKGTGVSGDFGGISDQALYQAAVTLNAEKKTAEYRAALEEFIQKQTLSPLVHACYKRLMQLDGKVKPEIEIAMQKAIKAQEEKAKLDAAQCGPKAVAYVLEREGKGAVDHETLSKECGTTKQGTTLDQMRGALQKHGLDYFGFKVGLGDLPKIACPAIWLDNDHYFVVLRVDGLRLTVYDPTFGSEKVVSFENNDDPKFGLLMLLKRAPGAEVNP